MRFEIEVDLGSRRYGYAIAFEFQKGFRDLRVFEEKLAVDGEPVFTRELAQIHLGGTNGEQEANFQVDWYLAALPIMQEQSVRDPLYIFKQWLRRMLILAPAPGSIPGESNKETLEPNVPVTNFAAWFSGLLAHTPSAYSKIDEYLRQVIPDLEDIKNPVIGTDSRNLVVQFSAREGSPAVTERLSVPFEDLSDGEKCFMICALVLVAGDVHGPVFCFWDEPDNYLAINEVGHFVMALRRAFQTGGQFIATSHNPEAIRRFSKENTLFLYRKSHLEPTVVRPLGELQVSGDLVGALIRGDVEP